MSRPHSRKPPVRLVVFGSLFLFAALFVLLTFELSASARTRNGGAVTAAKEPAHESVEPEYVEPEPEYVEPEVEYVEPEIEEAPPVVTTSS